VDEEEKFQIVRGNALKRYGIETDGPKTYQEVVAAPGGRSLARARG